MSQDRTAVRPTSMVENRGETDLDLAGFARGSLLSGAGTATAGVLQFLVVVVLTRGLPVGSIGVFFEAVAVVTIVSTACIFGSEAGLVREIARRRALDQADQVPPVIVVALVPVLALSLLAAGTLYLLTPAVSVVAFHAAQRAVGVEYLHALTPMIPLTALLVPLLGATRGFGTMWPTVALQQFAVPAARPLLVGVVLLAGLGATALALAWTVPVAVALVISLILLKQLLNTDSVTPGVRVSAAWRTEALPFWRFAAARGLASTIGLFAMLDVVLVGALDSARAAAIYAAASRFVILESFLMQAISRPLAPRFSELLARNDRVNLDRLYQLSTWWTVATGWPIYLMLVVFAPVVMRVFGGAYAGGGWALAILSLGCLLDLATGQLLVLLVMSGRSAWNLANSSGALLLNLVLNVLLIPRLGIEGAAIAWSASVALDNLATMLQVFWVYRIRPAGRTYLSLLIGAAVCFAAVGGVFRVALGTGLGALAVAAGAGLTLYAGFLRREREPLALGALRQAMSRSASAPPAPDGI